MSEIDDLRPPSVHRIAESLKIRTAGSPVSAAVLLREAKVIQKNWKKLKGFRDFYDLPGPKRPVINGTGILLHTNLGRAPLGEATLNRLARHLTGYVDLELNLHKGTRGGRTSYLDALFESMVPHYKPVWVNNNAAAVLLALNVARKTSGLSRLVISRGELVEIGGGFRVPEIMAESGFEMIEVGTTNKTRLADYEEALRQQRGVVCAVHPSNFTIQGFTESVPLRDLIALCRKYKVPFIYDAGTLSGDELRKLPQGFTCVTVSTDKTLGSIQGGLIAARPVFQKEILKSPLYRAMRLDKLSITALEVAMEAHAEKKDRALIPFSRMLHATVGELEEFARGFMDLEFKNFSLKAVSCESSVGGGSLPGQTFPSVGLELTVKNPGTQSQKIYEKALNWLRRGNPPVLASIVRSRPVVNLRTVFPTEQQALRTALLKLDERLMT